MTIDPEPTDKLGATTTVAVNGPEDEILGWHAIDWRACEDNVRQLRQRIFTASQAGDLKRVRNLQKLMLRSRANTLLSVRRVTERNAGRKTAGVDGELVLTPEAKADLAEWVQRSAEPWHARPVKRVYIPKRGSKKRRPLGIPVIVDRVLQARVVNALEPEWEARFEPRSYGFRPGRGCHDAIEAIYWVAKGKSPKRRWVLDADLAAAFDRIAHDHLLAMLGSFPARGMVKQWLKAGVVEDGQLTRTEEGTPQGGVVSPMLLNVALHGMEQAAGVRYHTTGYRAGETATDSPVLMGKSLASLAPASKNALQLASPARKPALPAKYQPAQGLDGPCHFHRSAYGRRPPQLIRYADDLIALCHSRDQALEVKAQLANWLAPKGLVFNEDKTRVVCLEEGFDFLGCNVRRYRGKLLIKPSKTAQRRIRERLRTEMWSLRGANAPAAIKRLNPIIRGWGAYYRTVVSSEVFSALDDYLWKLTYKWAVFSHSNKPKHWVIERYFDMFNKARRDQWVFGDRDSGAYLQKFAWTRIVRHQMVKGAASPDDPALAEYWAKRRHKAPPPIIGTTSLRLFKAQNGRCPLCGAQLLPADDPPQSPREWEQWLAATRKAIIKTATKEHGTSDDTEPRLIHAHCQRRLAVDDGHGTALLPAREPSRLA